MQFAEMQVKQNTRGIMLTARQEEWLTIQRLMADVKLKVSFAQLGSVCDMLLVLMRCWDFSMQHMSLRMHTQ